MRSAVGGLPFSAQRSGNTILRCRKRFRTSEPLKGAAARLQHFSTRPQTDPVTRLEGDLFKLCPQGQFQSHRLRLPRLDIRTHTFPESDTRVWVHNPSDATSERRPLVLIHGFGAGPAVWYRTLAAYTSLNKRRRVISMCLPGFETEPEQSNAAAAVQSGLHFMQARFSEAAAWAEPTNFRETISPPSSGERSADEVAEDFCVSSLERCRLALVDKGILDVHDRLDIVGHSLGAYCATAYALQYPKCTNKVVALSPVGIADSATLALNPPEKTEGLHHKPPLAGELVETFPALSAWPWGSGVPLLSLIRLFGDWGPSMVESYFKAKLHGVSNEEQQLLGSYIRQLVTRKRQGEALLHALFNQDGTAKRPLQSRCRHLTSAVSFVYGRYDWALTPASTASHEWLLKVNSKFVDSHLHIVPRSGHLLLLEQPEKVALLIDELTS